MNEHLRASLHNDGFKHLLLVCQSAASVRLCGRPDGEHEEVSKESGRVEWQCIIVDKCKYGGADKSVGFLCQVVAFRL